MTLLLAAVGTGLAVWVVVAAVVYLLTPRVGWLARRAVIGPPSPPGLCPVTTDRGGYTLACHLPAGHEVGLIHYDRSRDQRWASTPAGAALLGPGLRIL